MRLALVVCVVVVGFALSTAGAAVGAVAAASGASADGAGAYGVVGEGSVVATVSSDTTPELAGLRPGDMVRLRIWREPDLSGDFPVDAGGMVVLPKIGAQHVTGESESVLRERLVALYQRYLRNPSIDVIFLRRINVLGSVRSPGLIPVDPTMVVADLLALAGGVTPDGRQDRIQLIRGGEVLTTDISQRTLVSELPLQSGDQLYVPERGWFSRHNVGGALISAGLSLVTVLITIAVTR